MLTIGGKQLEPYRQVAKQVACCIMRDVNGDVDAAAKGRDDYEYELVTHAWLRLIEWHNGPRADRSPDDERRYIYKCIWNKARSFVRVRVRNLRHMPTAQLTDLAVPLDESFEERAMCRQTLRMLKARLEPQDWLLLCQIAVAEGDRRAPDTAVGRNALRREQRAKAQAKKRARAVSLFLETGVRENEDPGEASAGKRSVYARRRMDAGDVGRRAGAAHP